MKKIMRLIVVALVLGGSLSAGIAAAAQGSMESSQASAPAKSAKAFPFRGKISAVDLSAKTITLPGKEKNRVFQVTGETKIVKDGKPSTLESAKVGDEVGGRALAASDGKLDLVALRIGPKPEAGKKGDDEMDSEKPDQH